MYPIRKNYLKSIMTASVLLFVFFETNAFASGNQCLSSLNIPSTPLKSDFTDVTPIKDTGSYRYFTAISQAELMSKLGASLKKAGVDVDSSSEQDIISGIVQTNKDLSAQVGKDLAKVALESSEVDSVGFVTLPNGLVYLSVLDIASSGLATFYILYWDGKAVRAYIPDAGNLWNRRTKTPYGEQGLEDYLDLRERFPILAKQDVQTDEAAIALFDKISQSLSINTELMNQEITIRLKQKN